MENITETVRRLIELAKKVRKDKTISEEGAYAILGRTTKPQHWQKIQ